MIPVITLKVFFANSDPGYPGDPGVHFKSFFLLTLIPVIPVIPVITLKVFFANSNPGDHFKTFGRTFFD